MRLFDHPKPRTPPFEDQVANGVPPFIAHWRLSNPQAGEVAVEPGDAKASERRKCEAGFDERTWALMELANIATGSWFESDAELADQDRDAATARLDRQQELLAEDMARIGLNSRTLRPIS